MKFILGKKIGMTQIWKDEEVIAVTKVQAGPCIVIQIKDEKKDKYKAVQVGFLNKKEKNINKPQKKNFDKVNNKNFGYPRYIKEFRSYKQDENFEKIKVGDMINVDTFKSGDNIQVTGVSKGEGFQGVVKRHGFKGTKKTHGNKDQLRMPGSIGATGPAHVFKGTRMGGRTGGDKITIKNLEIVEVDKENNIIYIKGSVPGAINGLVMISGAGELKTYKNIIEEPKEIKKEEVKQENKKEKAEKNIEKVVENAKEKLDSKELLLDKDKKISAK